MESSSLPEDPKTTGGRDDPKERDSTEDPKTTGGGENPRSGPTETEDPSGSGEDPGSGPTETGGNGAGPVPSVFEDDGAWWRELAIEWIKFLL